MVGAPGHDTAKTDTGAVWVLRLGPTGVVQRQTLMGNGSAEIELEAYSNFGASVSHLGDVDGDGITDVAVSAPAFGIGPSSAGSVFVVFLRADDTSREHVVLHSGAGGGLESISLPRFSLGHGLTRLRPRFSGSYVDLVIGRKFQSQVVFVSLLPNGTAIQNSIFAVGDSGDPALGDAVSQSGLGSSLSNLGDLDGDGFEDVGAGASNYNESAGAVFILYTRHTSDGNLWIHNFTILSNGLSVINAVASGDIDLGSSAAIGDLDGDGRNDLVLGAPGMDLGGGEDSGGVLVLTMGGSRSGTTPFLAPSQCPSPSPSSMPSPAPSSSPSSSPSPTPSPTPSSSPSSSPSSTPSSTPSSSPSSMAGTAGYLLRTSVIGNNMGGMPIGLIDDGD